MKQTPVYRIGKYNFCRDKKEKNPQMTSEFVRHNNKLASSVVHLWE